MSFSVNCCENINISKFNCFGRKTKDFSKESDEKEIFLVKSKIVRFEKMIPENNPYLYLKIMKSGEIISCVGNFSKELGIKKRKIFGKIIDRIKTPNELFCSFICPLFKRSIETGESYQFCFKFGKKQKLICCSIYPCSIPGSISSVDCVIRPTVVEMDPGEIDQFAIKAPVQIIL